MTCSVKLYAVAVSELLLASLSGLHLVKVERIFHLRKCPDRSGDPGGAVSACLSWLFPRPELLLTGPAGGVFVSLAVVL